jgi:hypothetical protein
VATRVSRFSTKGLTIEGAGAEASVLSWPMMFKGTDWHPAKAKVVSKAAASERVRVIVLLHERAPTPTKAARGCVVS